MGNMSYCMFENTSSDMVDCVDKLDENNWDLEQLKENLSDSEYAGLCQMIVICRDIAESFEEQDV